MMHFPSVPVVIVAALNRRNRAIGYQNKLLWHIPEDLKRFKQLTLGHPVIMGRKTFESIVALLGKPLPGRTNIVVTRKPEIPYEGAVTAGSLEAAFAIAESENPTEIHIGGGAELYAAALPYVDRLHLTLVDGEAEGDTFFPEFENDFLIVKEFEPMTSGEIKYQWVDYQRN
ncbi:MAG TPA: dihydrofolate reductase [Candidatus Paceibacterota bacterium]|nr:dihydrofolate reductase [Candidatus Paceibacterota bacterium]HMO82858.1 dihydrofolate reductase [Candidatus Paceibacterota bacterium]